MKKLRRTLTSLLTIAALTLVPVAAHAQDNTVVEVGGTDTTTAAGIPNTGAAPENKLLQNSGIFVGGSTLGAALGIGIITMRKKRTNQ